jgi:hypothetical protein
VERSLPLPRLPLTLGVAPEPPIVELDYKPASFFDFSSSATRSFTRARSSFS